YNVLGQEVATLLNTETMNEGEHEIQFDASGLTSGVYFYKLTTGTFFETKKMLLMK
ncbi:MAG: T9SS type A sorting domain-containing protein, partial [Ignavibacteriales bacterium]|nr:T9SS type A sorting domain-containing protein [Ignavibacteriales bacterium]